MSSITFLGAAIEMLERYHAHISDNEFNFVKGHGKKAEAEGVTKTAFDSISSKVDDLPAKDRRNLLDIISNVTEGGFFTADLDLQIQKLAASSGKNKEGIEEKVVSKIANYVKLVYSKNTASTDTALLLPTGQELAGQPPEMSNIVSGGGETLDATLNSNPKAPNRFTHPSLTAISVTDTSFTPASRHVDAAALFSNFIPPIEMSRCTPYIDLQFVYTGETIDATGNPRYPSLIRFLGTQPNTGDASKNAAFVKSTPIPKGGAGIDAAASILEEAAAAFSFSGMEMLQSPQTLINPNINAMGESRLQDVIDPYRPFMSLMSVNTQQSGGEVKALMGSERAQVHIMLHDRSRLQEIAHLVSPSKFGTTTVILEYGWSHPDGGLHSDNPYAILLNHMRKRLKFNISKTDSTFTADGQVDIKIQMETAGAWSMNDIRISAGQYLPTNMLKPIIRQIAGNPGSASPQSKLPALTAAINAESGTSSKMFPVYTTEASDTFNKIIAGLRGQGGDTSGIDTTTIIESIEKALTDDTTVKVSEHAAVKLKTDAIRLITGGAEDPYMDAELWSKCMGGESFGGTHVSLGRAVLTFIGYPLAASRRVDEVQVIFYNANANAGMMGLENIAKFPLAVNDSGSIVSQIDDLMKDGKPAPTLKHFFEDIIYPAVKDEKNPAYGLGLPESVDTGDSDAEADANAGTEEDAYQARLAAIAVEKGIVASPGFKHIKLSMFAEVVPVIRQLDKDGNPTNVSTVHQDILRIHVFDEHASPHGGAKFLLQAIDSSRSAALYDGITTSTADEQNTSGDGSWKDKTWGKKILKAIEFLGGAEAQASTTTDAVPKRVFTSPPPTAVLRSYIKSTVPSITLGENASNITSISLSSTTDEDVGDAKMIENRKAQANAEDTTQGVTPSMIEPTMMYPARCSITMLGNPLMLYGQQFYIDMGSGTTADNIYQISDMRHSISPGSFTTTATMYIVASSESVALSDEFSIAMEHLNKKYADEG